MAYSARNALIVVFAACLMVSSCLLSFAQDVTPVSITFDESSERIDLKTGKQIPEYKYAAPGSVEMYLGRLDTPEKAVKYIRGGIMAHEFTTLNSMEKFQPKLDFWYFHFKNGRVQSGPVIQKAVSFIPLSLTDNTPQDRVYLLMYDIQAIVWETETQ